MYTLYRKLASCQKQEILSIPLSTPRGLSPLGPRPSCVVKACKSKPSPEVDSATRHDIEEVSVRNGLCSTPGSSLVLSHMHIEFSSLVLSTWALLINSAEISINVYFPVAMHVLYI